jgi:hypothetical protein
MFLSGVLFVMFLAGCWLYCLTDAALIPASRFSGLRKSVWITVIALTFIFGAIAWVIARSLRRRRRRRLTPDGRYAVIGSETPGIIWYPERPTAADVAFARHPATRAWHAEGLGKSAPVGPDDDPEFLRRLEDRIRGLD